MTVSELFEECALNGKSPFFILASDPSPAKCLSSLADLARACDKDLVRTDQILGAEGMLDGGNSERAAYEKKPCSCNAGKNVLSRGMRKKDAVL